MRNSANIYRKFHLKEPNGYVRLNRTIPEYMAFLGYAVDIGYKSDKWNKNGEFESYVHYFEHETKVLVFPRTHEMAFGRFKIRPPKEVTYLGYAVDFHFCDEDRSYISRNEDKYNLSPVENENDMIKVENTNLITFDANPETSRDFVVSDPEGRVVYIVCNDGTVYAFFNGHLEITSHGIEG
jgi:hypothetical protein